MRCATCRRRRRPVLVLTGKGRKTQEEGKLPPGTRVFADLAAFAEHLAP